ncbi:MAG: hypothetical protein II264_07680, partial [Ruminococcus sp.]|nr:hypothetical protein [Ruminococcus sp.]
LYHCRALQMMADLRMDFRLGNVELNFYDKLTPQALFESIQIIKSESERPKDTAGMTDDDISKLFANMRKNKK